MPPRPQKRRNLFARAATFPVRAAAFPFKAGWKATYPARHPIRTARATGRGTMAVAKSRPARATGRAALYLGRQGLRPVKATGRGIAKAGRGITYPARHPIKTLRAVETAWDSRRGKWVRKVLPYAAAAGVGAYLVPAAPVVGAAIGASATRAAKNREGTAAKFYSAVWRGVKFPFREGYAAGKEAAKDTYAMTVEQVRESMRREGEKNEGGPMAEPEPAAGQTAAAGLSILTSTNSKKRYPHFEESTLPLSPLAPDDL